MAKVLVAAGLAILVTAPAAFVSAIILGVGRDRAVGFAIGAAVAATLYVVVFLALSLLTSRALAIGLVYILVWEGVLAGLFAGTRSLSIRQYALGSRTRSRIPARPTRTCSTPRRRSSSPSLPSPWRPRSQSAGWPCSRWARPTTELRQQRVRRRAGPP